MPRSEAIELKAPAVAGEQARAGADELDARPVLFEGGPPLGLQRRIGLVRGHQLNVPRRALGVVLIAWIPLVVLTFAEDAIHHTATLSSLLGDAGVYARYALAAPFLVVADQECGRRLSAIVHNFVVGGLIRDEDRARFADLLVAARSRLDSRIAEAVVFALAALFVLAAAFSYPSGHLPTWHGSGGAAGFSWAGWWHVLVSLPLLLVLVLGWGWRFAVWAYLLRRIAGLDLRLVASHPDRAAGLGFLSQSLRAFWPLAAAFSAIAAGRSANLVMESGALPTTSLLFNVGLALAIVSFLSAPLLAFGPTLMRVWRDGTFAYGALASRVGAVFESKWLQREQADASEVLEKPDFSAAADLYGVVANVYSLRMLPVDRTSIFIVCGAVLLPFVPVVLLAVPIETMWSEFKKLMF